MKFNFLNTNLKCPVLTVVDMKVHFDETTHHISRGSEIEVFR